MHAWHEYSEVDIDICSCKEFSQEDAIAFAKEMFQTDDIEAHFVVRGTRSLRPENPDPARYEAAMAARMARSSARFKGGVFFQYYTTPDDSPSSPRYTPVPT